MHRRVGRKKEWHEQLRLPLAAGTTARIDSVLNPGEPRLDMIREAIEKEILRRRTLISRQRQAEAKFGKGE